jgi:cellulose synthase/poly-beta-1,6-N-acetylglucosamine synthase-like glycosyltransferase
MLLSVIVPTYGRPAYLRNNLISLLQQDLPPEQYEVIVVDNKPTGEVHRIIQNLEPEWQRPIHYVEESNVGLHNARHAGAKAARGETLVYVDDDAIAPSGWLRAILEPFEDPLVAIVGGKILPKWEAQPPKWLSQFPPSYLSLLDLGEERRELRWPEGAYGCNLAIRRSVLYEVGGFNPDAMGDRRLIWFRGDGESGLHRKVYAAGYKVIYEPCAWVYHRIPPERLKVEYLCERAYNQGVSDSFTQIRAAHLGGQPYDNRRDSRYYARRVKEMSLTELFQAVSGRFKRLARRIISPSYTEIRKRIKAAYWEGWQFHQDAVRNDSELFRYVLQDNYLDED